jgi:MFS family permease
MFAVRWSRFHIIIDFFVSFSFSLGAAALLSDRDERRRLSIISLIVMALSLGVITAFGHLETDDRLRLPAELIFLLVAPYGLQVLLHKVRALKRVRDVRGR